ncbi:ABC transporter permease, partial [Bifidobacterium leontopitheci]
RWSAASDVYKSLLSRTRLTFFGAMRGELVKALSLTSTYVLLIINALLMPAGTAITAWAIVALHTHDSTGSTIDAGPLAGSLLWQSVGASVSLCMIVAGIFGVMAVTSEYATSSIQSSLTANPRRVMFLNAKAMVTMLLAFASSLAGLLMSWGVAAMAFAGPGIRPLGDDEGALPVVALLGGAAVLALTAVMALGFGALFRSTVGGVLTVIGLLTIIPSILSMATLAGERMAWVRSVVACMPGNAASQFMSGPSDGLAASAADGVFTPNWWQSGLILLAWAVVVYAAGVLVARRADVK